MKAIRFFSAGSALVLGLLSATAIGCASAASPDDASSGESDITSSDAPAAITEAAAALKLGAAHGSDGSPDVVATYIFDKADVLYNHATSTVDSIKYHDQDLSAQDRNTVLTGDVLAAAINFKVGALKDTQGAAGTQYYDFERAAIGYSNVKKQLSILQPTDADSKGTSISGDVLVFATSLRLGTLTEVGNAAGSQYYTFEGGVVQYSNVTGQVSSVSVKAPATDLPTPVLSAVLHESFGRLLKVKTAPGHVDYLFQQAVLVVNEHGPLGINRN